MIWTTWIFFIAGFLILVGGADVLVRGATSFARRLRISPLLVGLVIAGIGTSIPEFAITIFSVATGREAIGLGTVIGSNTFNILAILGFTAIFFPMRMRVSWIHRDFIWNIFAVGAVIFFAIGSGYGIISRGEGIILLLFFMAWLFSILRYTEYQVPQRESLRILSLPIAFGFILAGFVGVLVGGKWVVDSAQVIALSMGLSEHIIGLTIVGIGTSLPELVVTLTAAYRRESGIAMGNIIGSNIFDFLMIIGFGAVIRPIPFSPQFAIDAAVTLAAALLLYASMFTGKRYQLDRWHGVVFLACYAIYLLLRL